MPKKVVVVTGASGSMGGEVIKSILLADKKNDRFKVVILLRKKHDNEELAIKLKRKYKGDIDIIFGDLSDFCDCEKIVKKADYILHCAAIIPPVSDHHPHLAESSNFGGTKNLIDAIHTAGRAEHVKFVEVGSVAEYGNRNYKHPWGRVGDPLIVSAYDFYAVTKLKAERYVIESGLKYWVSLRQSGILYDDILFHNLNDGLMFHTAWNTPIEWATARASGIMLRNLIEKDTDGTLPEKFWRNVYNIGNGPDARVTGFETVDRGFKMMGVSAKKIFRPNWNIARNFHCMWYYDSNILNDYLDFWVEGHEAFWKKLSKKLWYFKLGKPFPNLIRKFAIERLFKSNNSPKYWVKHNVEGRLQAFFGGVEAYNKIPDTWDNYGLLCENTLQDEAGNVVNYEELKDITKVKEKGLLLSHGYDETKPCEKIGLADCQQAAEFRGGKCLSTIMTEGDLYTKLKWEAHNGEVFHASPYLVLKAGHWAESTAPMPWNFGEMAKHMPFIAQVWYDSHTIEEKCYFSSECYKDIVTE